MVDAVLGLFPYAVAVDVFLFVVVVGLAVFRRIRPR